MYECVQNMKILIFDIYFFNMDISLIIAHICLRICMYIPKIYMDGRVSQILSLGQPGLSVRGQPGCSKEV